MEASNEAKRTLMPMRSDERLAKRVATDVLQRYEVNSILDIGCGDGVVGEHLPAKTNYLGLDIVEASIYEQKHGKPNIRYVQPNAITEIINKEGPWDMILLLDVLEHTRNFTGLFVEAMASTSKYLVVSLPNELFFLDRLRMVAGKELNAHSLDLTGQPEGFKHQFIINIDKARALLSTKAAENNFELKEEIFRPLNPKSTIMKIPASFLKMLSTDQLWSQGSIFIFERKGS